MTTERVLGARPSRSAEGERLVPETAQTIIDGVSLGQALLDVEVANARVVDLTHRLTDAVREIQGLRSQMLNVQVTPRATSGGVDQLAKELYDLGVMNEALKARLRSTVALSPSHQLL